MFFYDPVVLGNSFRLASITWFQRISIRYALAALVIGVAPSIAYGQCPAFGADTTCGAIITIVQTGNAPCPPTGCATVTFTGQGPYDGSDDTLVGVVNNSNLPVSSIQLASNNGAFGFDGDGIDTFGGREMPRIAPATAAQMHTSQMLLGRQPRSISLRLLRQTGAPHISHWRIPLGQPQHVHPSSTTPYPSRILQVPIKSRLPLCRSSVSRWPKPPNFVASSSLIGSRR